MVFLSLWVAGQTAALCPTATPSVKWLPSRLAAFVVTLVPIFWAIHVAITRIEDYVRDELNSKALFPDHVVARGTTKKTLL
jgi:hypothetical protein